MELAGRVALVTGAARRLGRALALALAEQGCNVIVHFGTSGEEAAATVEELRGLGVDAAALQADLSVPAEIERLFAAVEERFERLDLLVNSAASFRRQPLPEVTDTDWDAVLAVNLRAPFLCIRRAAPRIAASDRGGLPGLIVNLVDRSGIAVWPGYVQHGVSKAGLLHLTRISAVELAPEVRVNAIVPGAILPHPGRPAEDPDFRALGERLPLRRVGSPEDVGRALLFLTASDFVTGAALPVDGGEHLLDGGARR